MEQTARFAFAAILGLTVVLTGCSSSSGPNDQPPPVEYGSISGTVCLAGTMQPLPDVVIEIAGKSDTTAADGLYSIDSIANGSHTLRATRTDYEVFDEMVEVHGASTFDVELTIAIQAGNLHGRIWHHVYGPISSVKISVAGLFKHSDFDGYYHIENVPVGMQVVTCTHPSSYHGRTDTIYVTGSDNVFNVSLLRTVVNTIPISNDTYVQRHDDSPLYADSTAGYREVLRALNRHLDMSRYVKSRILLGLPALPTGVQPSELESATLKLVVVSKLSADAEWRPATLVVRRLLAPWMEYSVTWATAPGVTDSVVTTVKPPQSGSFEINVLPVYTYTDGIDPTFGIRLALDSDEANATNTEMIEIHSRESRTLWARPEVVLKYTH